MPVFGQTVNNPNGAGLTCAERDDDGAGTDEDYDAARVGQGTV
jgi:hypothetical protein